MDDKLVFAIRRDGEARVAIIRAVTDYPMTPDTVMLKLVETLTEWVNNTDEGKRAWFASSRDFNIGDVMLAGALETAEVSAGLSHRGVSKFDVDTYGSDVEPTKFTYDTLLIHTELLTEREDDMSMTLGSFLAHVVANGLEKSSVALMPDAVVLLDRISQDDLDLTCNRENVDRPALKEELNWLRGLHARTPDQSLADILEGQR